MALVECIDCDAKFNSQDNAERIRCWTCHQAYLEALRNPFSRRDKNVQRTKLVLPPEWEEMIENLPSLLQLCHPDRHGNSEGSQRITIWLTELKAKYGRRKDKR